MNNLISKLKKISIISILNLLVQVISVIGFTFTARLYTPHEIGEYMIYLSYVSILSIVSTGFYEQAIFIEGNKEKHKDIFILVLFLGFSISLISGILLKIFGISYYLYIIFAIFGTSVRVIGRTLAIVNNKLIFLSLFNFITSPLMSLSFIIGSLYFKMESHEFLILCHSSVTLFLSILLVIFTYKYFTKHNRKFEFKTFIYLLKRYKNLPQFKMSSELAGVLSNKAPTIVIKEFFSTSMAGYYGMAFRIAVTPITVITTTVSQMFLNYIIQHKSKNDIKISEIKQYSKLLNIIAFVVCCGIFIFSEKVIVFFFTDKYQSVSVILKLMIPYIIVLITVSPMLNTFVVFEQQKYLLYFKLGILICSVLSYTCAVLFNNIYIGFILYSIFSFVLYITMYKILFSIIVEFVGESIGKKNS